MILWKLQAVVALLEAVGDWRKKQTEARLTEEQRRGIARQRRRQKVIWAVIIVTSLVIAVWLIWHFPN